MWGVGQIVGSIFRNSIYKRNSSISGCKMSGVIQNIKSQTKSLGKIKMVKTPDKILLHPSGQHNGSSGLEGGA